VRAIVTGGAGFIGSHLTDALVARGDEVTVLDDLSSGRRENVNEAAQLVEADIRDARALEGAFASGRPEVCFHLAAQADVRVSVEQPDFDADVNVLGTIRVLQAARGHDAQVVFASSGGAIYGECDGPAPEDAPLRPLAPYGTAKLAAEEYLATYNRLYRTRHASLRYGNVYGPRQDPHGEAGVIAIFFGRLARGEGLRVFGDGRQTRDYVFVQDTVAATLAALGRGGVFNVGTGIETSVNDLYDVIRRAVGSDAEAERAPAKAGEQMRSVLDGSRLRTLANLPEPVRLEEGIRRTVAWLRSS
jgi:UDP-glucose 4-epimerase